MPNRANINAMEHRVRKSKKTLTIMSQTVSFAGMNTHVDHVFDEEAVKIPDHLNPSN